MKIDDTAQGIPMTAASAAIASLSLMDKKDDPPTACCPKDGEPLIFTFKYPGAEFVCMVCGGMFGFLAPRPKDSSTPGLAERHEYLQTQFDAGVAPGNIVQEDANA